VSGAEWVSLAPKPQPDAAARLHVTDSKSVRRPALLHKSHLPSQCEGAPAIRDPFSADLGEDSARMDELEHLFVAELVHHPDGERLTNRRSLEDHLDLPLSGLADFGGLPTEL
jgi:hypothetical protein